MLSATINSEIWKPVVGFEGRYEVSDQGRVRSMLRTVVYVDGRKRNVGGKILSLTQQKGRTVPYLQISLHDGDKFHCRLVHRLVLEAFVGQRPENLEARHGAKGFTDNSVSNLSWGTRVENMADKVRDGTAPIWENNPYAKLNAQAAKAIRESSEVARSLADFYGVTPAAIRDVRLGRTW